MKNLWLIAFLSLGLTGCRNSDSGDMVVSQKYIHKYGFEVDKTEWNERDQDGKVEAFLKNGVKVTKTYENGKLHGRMTFTFPYSSTIEKILVYDQGELLRETIHDKKGVPIREDAYEFDNRKVITYWDDRGVPMRIEEFEDDTLMQGTYFDSDGEIEAKVDSGTGVRIKRSRDGTLTLKDRLENGDVIHRTTYHANGETYVVSNYEEGVLNGEQLTYNRQGELEVKALWNHGVLDGIKTTFRNGTKFVETPYVNGLREGVQKRFDEEGNLVQEVAFTEDQKHGPCIFYDGSTEHKEWFYKGHATSEKRFDVLNSRDELVAELDE